APDASISAFKDTWGALGDSIVVVGGDGIWNCHVHTNEIGAAVEAGIEAGRPHQIRVTDLFEQVAHEHEWVAAGVDPGASGAAALGYDPAAVLRANVAALTEAAARVRTGEVTRAVRDASTDFGPVHEGDWIAIDARGICAATATAVDAVTALLTRLVDDDTEI